MHQASAFLPVLASISFSIRNLLNALPVQKLNELSKRALNRFLSSVNAEQNEILKEYQNQQQQAIEDLTKTDTTVIGAVLEQQPPTDTTSISRAIRNNPIAANGVFVPAFLSDLTDRVKSGIIDIIRKGYVNGFTIEEIQREILGSRLLNFRDGFFNRLKNWNKAVVNTVIQHTSSVVANEVSKLFHERYLWVSVMDDRTTEICQSRNGKVYVYGEGPVPPAHINCRSTIVPIISSRTDIPGFNDWLEHQSAEFKNDMNKPMTLDEFGSKINIIVGENDDA